MPTSLLREELLIALKEVISAAVDIDRGGGGGGGSSIFISWPIIESENLFGGSAFQLNTSYIDDDFRRWPIRFQVNDNNDNDDYDLVILSRFVFLKRHKRQTTAGNKL